MRKIAIVSSIALVLVLSGCSSPAPKVTCINGYEKHPDECSAMSSVMYYMSTELGENIEPSSALKAIRDLCDSFWNQGYSSSQLGASFFKGKIKTTDGKDAFISESSAWNFFGLAADSYNSLCINGDTTEIDRELTLTFKK